MNQKLTLLNLAHLGDDPARSRDTLVPSGKRHKSVPSPCIAIARGSIIFFCLLVTVCFGAEPPDKAGAARPVMEVSKVTVKTVISTKEQLIIEATGVVNTGGWDRVALVPEKSEEEGVLVFNFMGVPPQGMATQALAPVKATVTTDEPANFKEVRIVAKKNKMAAR